MKRLVPWMFLVAIAGVLALVIAWGRNRDKERLCGDNLKYIGAAIRNYSDAYGRFPSADADGHSWRIRIVPFMFASSLYGHYRFDEPWDSENNRTLDSRPLPVKDGGPNRPHGMPFPYECPARVESRGRPSFLMFVGENAFAKPGGYRLRTEIADPLESTLVAAETMSTTIHWLEPIDFSTESMSFTVNDPAALSISSHHRRGPAVLFADGEVYRLSPRIDAETLRALITIDGGEDVDRSQLLDRKLLRRY